MTTNSSRHSQSVRYCNPNCQYFKCSKRAMGPKRKVRGRTRIICNFVSGDYCTGSRCTYSFCVKHKLRPNGTCGLTNQSQRKIDDEKIEAEYEKELIKKDQTEGHYEKKYLKDKYRRKLKGIKW
ncbi:MAG: hypothetical protein ACTSRC_01635 [Candidatus Helarchaeota archaeon]